MARAVVFKKAYWFSLNTPKALANFSPGLEQSDNPGTEHKRRTETLKGFLPGQTLSGFNTSLDFCSPGSRKLEPWAKISQRFGVFKLNQYFRASKRLTPVKRAAPSCYWKRRFRLQHEGNRDA
jgi:hypothetical protein